MMIPLDSFEAWSPRLDACAGRFLSADEQAGYAAIPPAQRQAQLRALLERPISAFTSVNDAYFRARWADTLELLAPGRDLSVLEVATGDADMIPQALSRLRPGSLYVTANVNRALNESLLRGTRGLDVRLRLIEDDAANIGNHFGPAQFDIVAFQHGVNDVAQGILCARAGVDTAFGDWMELLPGMISMLQREVAEGTLEEHIKEPFLALLRSQLGVLKPGGFVAINHYLFQLDLDWGYPPELFALWLPLVRGWMKELDGAKEVFFDGYEPNWWIFLRKG